MVGTKLGTVASECATRFCFSPMSNDRQNGMSEVYGCYAGDRQLPLIELDQSFDRSIDQQIFIARDFRCHPYLVDIYS